MSPAASTPPATRWRLANCSVGLSASVSCVATWGVYQNEPQDLQFSALEPTAPRRAGDLGGGARRSSRHGSAGADADRTWRRDGVDRSGRQVAGAGDPG